MRDFKDITINTINLFSPQQTGGLGGLVPQKLGGSGIGQTVLKLRIVETSISNATSCIYIEESFWQGDAGLQFLNSTGSEIIIRDLMFNRSFYWDWADRKIFSNNVGIIENNNQILFKTTENQEVAVKYVDWAGQREIEVKVYLIPNRDLVDLQNDCRTKELSHGIERKQISNVGYNEHIVYLSNTSSWYGSHYNSGILMLDTTYPFTIKKF